MKNVGYGATEYDLVLIDENGSRSGFPGPSAYLSHSCDDWTIGGVEQIDMMIADLRKAKKALLGLVQNNIEKLTED